MRIVPLTSQRGSRDATVRGSCGVQRTVIAGLPATPRIALPSDLSTSLQYLDDAALERLLAAVNAEVDRRKGMASAASTVEPATPTASRSAPARHEEVPEIPEGKVNLIRASFGAGMKPPTIARTFGVSLSPVKRVIRRG